MKRAVITTPIPTLDEVAKSYGIGKQRQHELLRIVQKHLKAMPAGSLDVEIERRLAKMKVGGETEVTARTKKYKQARTASPIQK